jgi:ribulose 1,5-bisphosphate synthetase/thiazole synthase
MTDFILPHNATSDLQATQRLGGPIHTERHLNIICVGAGASGLLMAYKLQKHFQNFTLTVYEKNPEVSGTWFENRYPGSVFLTLKVQDFC